MTEKSIYKKYAPGLQASQASAASGAKSAKVGAFNGNSGKKVKIAPGKTGTIADKTKQTKLGTSSPIKNSILSPKQTSPAK